MTRAASACGAEPAAVHAVALELGFRPPLAPGNLFGHLAATAIPGVEEVREATYRRTLRLPGGPGIAELTPTREHVACRLALSDARDEDEAVAACRWLLDLDADPGVIDAHLKGDPMLAARVAEAPGRRVPRTVDGAEMAIRAVLGQQVSTAAARTHGGRLAAELGEPVADPWGGLSRLFPEPSALRSARFAVPTARARSLAALIDALAGNGLALERGGDIEAARAALAGLPGIGPWTTEIIAMRALGDPDAFPASDLGVLRGAAALGLPGRPRPLAEHASAWRPWRAYAVQHLWGATPHAINRWPPQG
jgi:AraC family transcriptional regulator, regulatory protein of adaptative response / DNA-3-methyladenine glycosylase II